MRSARTTPVHPIRIALATGREVHRAKKLRFGTMSDVWGLVSPFGDPRRDIALIRSKSSVILGFSGLWIQALGPRILHGFGDEGGGPI